MRQWDTVKTHIEVSDVAFLCLRVVILWGLGGWLAFTDVARDTFGYMAGLIVFFVIYSIFIYIILFFLPRRKKIVYGCSLFFDFLFTSLLVQTTGGILSPFTNGFYLMTALYSFYFGPAAAVVIAVIATVLYRITAGPAFDELYWTDFSVRAAFLFLLALPLGFLSRKLEKNREELHILKKQLDSNMKELQKVRGRISGDGM